MVNGVPVIRILVKDWAKQPPARRQRLLRAARQTLKDLARNPKEFSDRFRSWIQ